MNKIIITTKQNDYRSGIIIPDHYDNSLESFQELANIAMASFPRLKPSDIRCRTVVESRRFKKMPAVFFPLLDGEATPDGFTECDYDNLDVVLS